MPNKGIDPYPHNPEAASGLVEAGAQAVQKTIGGLGKLGLAIAARRASKKVIRDTSGGTQAEAEGHQSDVEDHLKVISTQNRHRIREIRAQGDVQAGLGELERRHVSEQTGALRSAKKVTIKTPSGYETTFEN